MCLRYKAGASFPGGDGLFQYNGNKKGVWHFLSRLRVHLSTFVALHLNPPHLKDKSYQSPQRASRQQERKRFIPSHTARAVYPLTDKTPQQQTSQLRRLPHLLSIVYKVHAGTFNRKACLTGVFFESRSFKHSTSEHLRRTATGLVSIDEISSIKNFFSRNPDVSSL